MEIESMTLTNVVLCKFMNDIFIETGSYDGRTIQQALDCGFKEVRSVELDKTYYDICVERYAQDARVKLYLGDSIDILPSMIAGIIKPATFWLDSHIQTDVKGKYAAPLLHEIDVIATHPIDTHTIIIDDRRLMGIQWWKDIIEFDVLEKLYQINDQYTIEYFDSKVAEKDIIVAHV